MRTSRSLVVTAAWSLALVGLAPTAHADAPVNDEPSTATVVSGLPFEDSASTEEATSPEQDGCGGTHSVWWAYTPEQDVTVDVATFGSSVDTVLGQYVDEGSGPTAINCADDGYGGQESFRTSLSAETTYYFRVASAGDTGGHVVLRLDELPPALSSVDVEITSAAVQRDGTVLVNGTVVCDQPGSGDVYVQVRQSAGRFIANGGGGTGLQCSPEASTWRLTVQSHTAVRFGAGEATLTGSVYVYGNYGYADEDITPRTLKLRRTR